MHMKAGPTHYAERPMRKRRGFSLMELLVVIGLIAGLSVFLVGNLSSGGRSSALQSAQATAANMLAATRMKAMASGQSVRFLVNVDLNSTASPSRYLRYVAIQVQVAGVWQPVADAYLPEGVYVVPGNFATIPAGLFPPTASDGTPLRWLKADGSNLRSTSLRAASVSAEQINSPVAEQWVNLPITATGTTGSSGDLILALGRQRPPGSFTTGESPIELEHPEKVRGLTVSLYGVAAMINSLSSF